MRTGEDVIDVGIDPNMPAPIRQQFMSLEVPDDPIAAFEKQSALLAALRPKAIALTKPADWVDMGGKMYLQATGGERVTPLYGMVFGRKIVNRENYEDGSYAYFVEMPVFCRITGVYYASIEGGRWSGEEFFDSFDAPKPDNFRDMPKDEQLAWRSAHRIPPNPIDVKKAAATNCEIRAVGKAGGLRGLTREDLEACGVKVTQKVSYGRGARGGGGGEGTIPYGDYKGQTPQQLSDKDLAWWTKHASEKMDHADYKEGGKHYRYRARNAKLLEALKREVDDRINAKAAEAGE
jgi:hypothetical protein